MFPLKTIANKIHLIQTTKFPLEIFIHLTLIGKIDDKKGRIINKREDDYTKRNVSSNKHVLILQPKDKYPMAIRLVRVLANE